MPAEIGMCAPREYHKSGISGKDVASNKEIIAVPNGQPVPRLLRLLGSPANIPLMHSFQFNASSL